MEKLVATIETQIKALQEALNKHTDALSKLENDRTVIIAEISKLNGAIVGYRDSANLMKQSLVSDSKEANDALKPLEGEIIAAGE
jgi:chromosome segregation ATPase